MYTSIILISLMIRFKTKALRKKYQFTSLKKLCRILFNKYLRKSYFRYLNKVLYVLYFLDFTKKYGIFFKKINFLEKFKSTFYIFFKAGAKKTFFFDNFFKSRKRFSN